MPGLTIVDGTLVVDAVRLAWPGDILHEAAHIALTPPSRRAGWRRGARCLGWGCGARCLGWARLCLGTESGQQRGSKRQRES